VPYLRDWLTVTRPFADAPNVIRLVETDGARAQSLPLLAASVLDHLIGHDILERLRFTQSAQAVRNRLPTEKRIRSGTLGEIIATDYVIETGPFVVPLKRLRYMDDRELAMRGDDLIAIDTTAEPVRVLKAEVKSRATLSNPVVTDMCSALDRNEGRPKPSSLSFISMTLRREGRDEHARIIELLQETDVELSRMVHLAFTVSGNDPGELFRARALIESHAPERRFVGVVLPDHAAFIAIVFAACNA
jgi:hypothetical protein